MGFASYLRNGEVMRSSAVLFVMAVVTFGLAGDTASAGTIMLRGIYSRSALGADCVEAGGTPTPGMELNGFGCKTDKGEVE